MSKLPTLSRREIENRLQRVGEFRQKLSVDSGSQCTISVVRRRFEQPRLFLLEGKPDAESSATAKLAFEVDSTAMGTNNALDDHQTQAGAFLFGCVKWFENAVELFLRDPAPGIGDTYPNTIRPLPGLYSKRAAFGHGLHGIFDQVEQDLLHLNRIQGGHRQLAPKARLGLQPAVVQLRPKQLEGFGNYL